MNISNTIGREKLQGHLALLFANTAWGLMAPISKSLLNMGIISPLALSGVRIMGGALLFWLVSTLVPNNVIAKEKVEKGDFIKIFFVIFTFFGLNRFPGNTETDDIKTCFSEFFCPM